MNVRALAALAAILCTSLAATPAPTQVPYSVATPHGAVAGTLTMPATNGPVPVVLIIAGSGGVDRDGNAGAQERSDSYKQLALALAARGIATLRYDKPGVGESAKMLQGVTDVTLSTYTDAAAACVKALKNDPRFSRVIVAGHSEGSLIATLLAQRGDVSAIALLEGPGRPLGVVLREQLHDRLKGMPELLAYSDAALDAMQKGQVYATPAPQGLQGIFAPGVQHFLLSDINTDPAAELARVRVPVVIVQGTHDIQTTMADGDALHHALPSASYVVIPNGTHMLKDSPSSELAGQYQTVYMDPTIPLDPAVVQAVASVAKP